eukprot:NODE_8479_length_1492_cov_10.572161.p1 GENE.NODE_8479_length_1492_cov_10.572161~~NODE_8479_length_1492_cov_10.572161.p1  ORF type:complete len:413 (-),score=108.70 NODE_8479_length_1492_cov_10.572161:162-1400(-)
MDPVHEVSIDTHGTESVRMFRVPMHYEFVKKLGSGSYGNVASFKDTRENRVVAVKKVTRAFHDLEDGRRIIREVKLLLQVSHPNLIRILDLLPPESPDFEDIYIVVDVMGSDLHRVINSKQLLDDEHVQFFLHQILRGLHYLHSADITHRDLKPANLLVNQNCDLQICDFGLARVLTELDAPTDYVVTRWYRAPEVVLAASEYTRSIDVWAVGCILCELVGRKPVFRGRDHLDQIKRIITIVGTPSPEDLDWLPKDGAARRFLQKECPQVEASSWASVYPEASAEVVEVIEAMLHFVPKQRVTVEQALRLPYLRPLFDEEHMKEDTRPSPINWSFDVDLDNELTKRQLQNLIYSECAALHPMMIERDKALLASRGLGGLLPKGASNERPRRRRCSLPCFTTRGSRYRQNDSD